ncbi:MAG TPA: CHAD domain-containing protein [Leptolyngbyaceae cyanobacterium M65_K2018_010]|nr:CHAD domain-containing protein [Leptolyngbyaceae cyanobacterium M65_K2018_010]
MASRTFGDLAQTAIAKYLKQSIAYEKLVLADTDPENLHQMRVGLRRLRTALQVFALGVKLPKAAREPQVAEIGRQLGELRDLDVIEATLRDRFLPDLPDPEQVLLAQVLEHLNQQRRQTFKRVKKLLSSDRYRQMKRSLKDWIKTPEFRGVAPLPAEVVVPDLALPLVSHLWLHPGWLVGTKVTRSAVKVDTRLSLPQTDALIAEQGTTLHSLRKQVKRVRYQLRLVADLYGDRLEADIQRLSDMQDTLGHLQDSAVLEQFIAIPVAEARTQMPTLFALLADSRHRAWKQWQTHQQFYLDAEHRQQLRLMLLQPDQGTAEPAAARPPASPRTTKKVARPPA